MALADTGRAHPVLTGVVCFAVLAGALIGGISLYAKHRTGSARRHAVQVNRDLLIHVRRLERAFDAASQQFKMVGPVVSTEERISLNRSLVIVEENLSLYCSVLSNAQACLERNEFELFRSVLDGAQQSDLLQRIDRDRLAAEQVIKYCRDRAHTVPSPPAPR